MKASKLNKSKVSVELKVIQLIWSTCI